MEEMKSPRLIRCVALIFLLVLNSGYAQDFNDGVDAYLNGDYKKAFDIWTPLATGGDAVAMFNIGVLHSQGLGVPVNLEEGVNWYRQSAVKGYAPAQFNLGVAFREAKGTRKSSEKASQWFRAAAEQNHRHAQYNLASLYWIGDGVDKNREEAVKWFEKAAKSGDPRAKQILARIKETPAVGDSTDDTTAIAEKSDDDSSKNDAASSDEAVEDSKMQTPTDSSEKKVVKEEKVKEEDKKEIVADTPINPQDKPEQKEIEEPAAPVKKDAKTASATQSAGDTEQVNGSAWIVEQPKDNYTIQVFADQGSVKGSLNFIKSNKLKQANRFTANGWNKIVVGTYPSREAAKQAVSQLPQVVQKQQPWIRLFADVQAEMDDADEQTLSEKASEVEQKLFAATDDAMSKSNLDDPGSDEQDLDKNKSKQELETQSNKTEETAQTQVAAVTEPAESEEKTEGLAEQIDASQSDNNNKDESEVEKPLDVSEMTIRQRLDIAHDAFIEQDYLNAHRMWEPLAYAGYAEAQYGLAYLLETGSGVSRSEQDAFEWYRLAAEQGHSQAQFNLGLFYMEGRGVMNNEGLGLYWIQTAADNKEQRAKDYLVSYRENSAKEQ